MVNNRVKCLPNFQAIWGICRTGMIKYGTETTLTLINFVVMCSRSCKGGNWPIYNCRSHNNTVAESINSPRWRKPEQGKLKCNADARFH